MTCRAAHCLKHWPWAKKYSSRLQSKAGFGSVLWIEILFDQQNYCNRLGLESGSLCLKQHSSLQLRAPAQQRSGFMNCSPGQQLQVNCDDDWEASFTLLPLLAKISVQSLAHMPCRLKRKWLYFCPPTRKKSQPPAREYWQGEKEGSENNFLTEFLRNRQIFSQYFRYFLLKNKK